MKNKLLAIMATCAINVSAQYSVKPIPATFLSGYSVTTAERTAALASLTAPYDLTGSLPSGYVTDGSVNYRSQLQAGIDAHNDITFPDFPVMVDSVGLKLKSNTRVLFKTNSKLILKSNAAIAYNIMHIADKKNIVVYFANIEGDRYTHIPVSGSTSEQGHGLLLERSDSIFLIKPKMQKCNGDGIKIVNTTTPTYGVVIEKGILNENRRNGLSVISANILTVNGLIASNSNGVKPQVGVDLEPEGSGHQLKNIEFNDLITYNNYSTGVSIYPRKLLRSNLTPVKDVSITFNKPIDSISDKGMGITTSWADSIGLSYSSVLDGSITVNCPSWRSPRSGTYITVNDPRNNNECDIDLNFAPTIIGYSSGHPLLMCDKSGSLENEVRNQTAPLPANTTINCELIALPCALSGVMSVIHGTINDILPVELQPAIIIHPNPATDRLKITGNMSLEGFEVTVISIDGKPVYREILKGYDNELDISKLPAGLYLLKASKDKEIFFERFAKY